MNFLLRVAENVKPAYRVCGWRSAAGCPLHSCRYRQSLHVQDRGSWAGGQIPLRPLSVAAKLKFRLCTSHPGESRDEMGLFLLSVNYGLDGEIVVDYHKRYSLVTL